MTCASGLVRPRFFALQWHITSQCNWRCRHCYQDARRLDKELSLKELREIFGQYRSLIRRFGTLGPRRARLIIAGGEPFLSDSFFPLLEHLRPYNKEFFLALLSNGSLVTVANAARLRSLGVKVVQMSLEGMEKENDAVRGDGAFRSTFAAARLLTKAGVKVGICVTLTRRNVRDIDALVRQCEKAGISQMGIRRLVAIGRARLMREQMLTPRELKGFFLHMEAMRKRREAHAAPVLAGGCDESVFCQELDRPLINCAVTEGRMLTVLPDGKVLPCRRLPLPVGDALRQELADIYYGSPLLRRLRNLNNAFRLCRECPSFGGCLSGAKCVSYAYFGKLSAPDPQCWRIFDRLPSPQMLKHVKDRDCRDEMNHFTLMSHLFRHA